MSPSDPSSLKSSARAVQDFLESRGVSLKVVELPASTRTAKEAAAAIGCTVAQIAKSIVFRARESGRAVMVVASGTNRIHEPTVAGHLGEKLGKASPEFVREATGFAIGGVPPCGHATPVEIYLDRDLFDLEELWAAAGTPNAVFALKAEDLLKLTEGTVIDVTGRLT